MWSTFKSLKEKKALVEHLEMKYGPNWKTPLSKEIGVDLSTVRRLFNQREGELPKVYELAIKRVIFG